MAGTTRLHADDWLQAALDIMVDDGIAGVKIHRLCERLGVTKGSFYWHFADLDAFLGELARRWGERGLDARADGVLEAMHLFADKRNRDLTRAVRDWARHDDRARAALRKADRSLFEAVRAALLALGFSDDEADVRAKVLYYAGIGFAHVGPLGNRTSAQEQLAATWELLTRR